MAPSVAESARERLPSAPARRRGRPLAHLDASTPQFIAAGTDQRISGRSPNRTVHGSHTAGPNAPAGPSPQAWPA